MKIETDESGGRVFFSTHRTQPRGTRTRSACSASASTSARRPRTSCSRASCWSGSTAATSSPSARPSTHPTSCSRPIRPRTTIDADALGAFIEKQYEDAMVDPDEIDTGALILTGVAVPPQQRARDRRTVRRAGRQARRGQRRRQPRNRDGGLRLRRGRALDPRRVRGDERRCRRRHLQDRGVRRRQGDRDHRGRCRRAPRLPGAGRQHHARSRKPAAASAPSSGSTSRSAAC